MIAEHTQSAKAVSKHKSPAPTQKNLEEDTALQDTVLPKDNPATSTKSGSSEKICLSVAQRDRVDLVFAEDIQSGIEPRKKRMVALMRSDLILRGLINSQPHVKRVVDRMRYLFDKRSSWIHLIFHRSRHMKEPPTLSLKSQTSHHQPSNLGGWSGRPKRWKVSKRP